MSQHPKGKQSYLSTGLGLGLGLGMGFGIFNEQLILSMIIGIGAGFIIGLVMNRLS